MPQSAQPDTRVQVIIPARNEEECLGRCLESLVGQQGVSFQITVVDDGSTDRTAEIARAFAGVRVISSTEPERGANGKCNALMAGVAGTTAPWLLFTDADTVHAPGSLASALREAEEHGADLLSYSPEQETGTWGERLVMPLVYAELAKTYPPARVNDPGEPVAAANGQYILVKREAYEAVGGHGAVRSCILEDVELAKLMKRSGRRIWFRMGRGAVRTRMYRNFRQMVEGWTKGLTLLFENPRRLALQRMLEFVLIAGLPAAAIGLMISGRILPGAAAALAGLGFYTAFLLRIRKAHFPQAVTLTSVFGLPIFSWLLLRSERRTRRGLVQWKGRSYGGGVGSA